jgi:hypothetical protein
MGPLLNQKGIDRLLFNKTRILEEDHSNDHIIFEPQLMHSPFLRDTRAQLIPTLLH